MPSNLDCSAAPSSAPASSGLAHIHNHKTQIPLFIKSISSRQRGRHSGGAWIQLAVGIGRAEGEGNHSRYHSSASITHDWSQFFTRVGQGRQGHAFNSKVGRGPKWIPQNVTSVFCSFPNHSPLAFLEKPTRLFMYCRYSLFFATRAPPFAAVFTLSSTSLPCTRTMAHSLFDHTSAADG